MAVFSPSDAALAGFKVLGRHWRVAVGWAVFNLLAMLCVIVVGAVVGAGLELSASGGDDTAAGAVIPFIAVLGAFLVEMVIGVALYRLLLRPEQPAFLYLRLGADELRVVAVGLALLLGVGLIAGVAFFAGRAVASVRFGPVLVAAAAFAVVFWLAMRFSLAAPIAFAERRIDFAGAWRLTRGRAASLFGMWLLNSCVLAMLWVVGWIALFLVNGFTGGFAAAGAGSVAAFEAHPGRYLVEGALSLMLTPILLVLQQTPFVAAYQALREPA